MHNNEQPLGVPSAQELLIAGRSITLESVNGNNKDETTK